MTFAIKSTPMTPVSSPSSKVLHGAPKAARSSGILRMTSPFLISSPSPLPPAIPISASFGLSRSVYHTAHDGYFQIQRNILHHVLLPGLPVRSDRSVSVRRSDRIQPQCRLCEAQASLGSAFADFTSSSGSPVRETRIVSPIP